MPAPVPDKFALVPRCAENPNDPPLNVFSVDVEEWFQVGAFENTLRRFDWQTFESRVAFQTETILDILARFETRATFFCLGWVAERKPSLLRKIADGGHEIGCHGMDHRRIFTLTTDEFSEDIRRAKLKLEDASGVAVKGYRAPSFSMTPEIWHYYDQLVAEGFQYSSSIVPAKTDHYGAAGLPRVPFYPLKNEKFVEVPMTVARLPGLTVPASGGGYFRLLPEFASAVLMKRAYGQTGIGTIFYMHPWEIDPEQPYVAGAPFLSRFRHYTGQGKMAGKISRLLARQRFTRLDTWLEAILGRQQ